MNESPIDDQSVFQPDRGGCPEIQAKVDSVPVAGRVGMLCNHIRQRRMSWFHIIQGLWFSGSNPDNSSLIVYRGF